MVIHLAADDHSEILSSEISKTVYSVDGSPFIQYEHPLDIFIKEKVYKLSHYSIDRVGNIESTHSTELVIDVSPPQSKHMVSGRYFREILSDATEIQLDSFDNLSGLAHIYYYFDSGEELIYNEAFTLKTFSHLNEGNHQLFYYSVDEVGNMEKTRTFTFFLDHSPPAASLMVLDASYLKDHT